MNATETPATATLKERWDNLLSTNPALRIRNAAAELGVSEAELLATRIGDGVTRLRPDFRGILGEVGKLGRVMALTRNNDVVHERKGTYLNPQLGEGHVGLFVGAEIDLRIFWHAWAHAFAVLEPGKEGVRYSLQFFAPNGEAIHKIYLIAESDAGAYHDLVQQFRSEDQAPEVQVAPMRDGHPERPDTQVDVAGLQQEWLALKDTHDFHLLLRKYMVSRSQALRLAPAGDYAVPVNNLALRTIITKAAAEQCPIMVFVGNPGMLQIHTGEVTKVMDVPEWFNVIDPDFNLHMREGAIANSWIVRKPSVDGMITALECYDSKGSQLIQLFGKRKPGIPELEQWRALVAAVEAEQRLA